MYDEIKATVGPRVQFVQGIPDDLDQDEFFDPRFNNLIILDDLMSTASKNPQITDLFTEGSHHRNLSVIAINQNLYYSKDPTQRRNCHYLALFNNPVDQQPIMTLARQMYPSHPEKFMEKFREATDQPYGYLLVDLKPTTLASDRLVTNGLDESSSDELSLDGLSTDDQPMDVANQPQQIERKRKHPVDDLSHDDTISDGLSELKIPKTVGTDVSDNFGDSNFIHPIFTDKNWVSVSPQCLKGCKFTGHKRICKKCGNKAMSIPFFENLPDLEYQSM